MRSRRSTGACAALAISAVAVVVATASPAGADDTPQTLPFAQDWSNAALITTDDDWSGVPGVVGYRGDGLASTGADPQEVLSEGTPVVVDVNADEANPNTITTGGVAEFAIADPVVALQGSGTADAPNLVLTLSTAGFVDIAVAYDVRDIDGSADNAVQQVALQYRVGTTGNFTNLPAGYIADATTGPSLATVVTPVAVTLPPAADDQPVVQVRVITADAPLSDEWVGIDNISVTTPGGGGPAEPVASCPASLVTVAGTAASAGVSASDADSTIASIGITSPTVSGITLEPAGTGAATLVVGATTAPGTYPVTITFVTDDDPPQSVSCTISVSVLPITLISDVQGDGASTPLAGTDVVVQAVVTSLFTTDDAVSGFTIQEEDADADDSPATSEGVFVNCGAACPASLAGGDLVTVTGDVFEEFGLTRIRATAPGAIVVESSGNARPTPAAAALPAPSGTNSAATFESIESMVTTVPGTLVVSEFFELARFGQIELTAGGRPFQFTHGAAPSVAGFQAHLAELATRTIVLDDDNDDQNDAISDGPDEVYPYPQPGLSVGNRFRGGDTITDLTGVIEWSFGVWRIRPIPSVEYTFEQANPVPAAPGDLGGDLKIASFNVLNYFTTIDETSGNAGPCGPSMTLDCRGADSAAELAQQRAKIVAAIGALDADVVGLIELENDAVTPAHPLLAVADLVAGLNARPGAAPYAFVDTGFIGTDAIKVAFIYRPSRVTPFGAYDILDSSDDPTFIDTRNRPALIQTFEEVATGERFTAAINHFKSKGSPCLPDDPDVLDGQGNCNLTRTAAAIALAAHLADDPTGSDDPDVIILGDLNSYRREDPITALIGAGYNDLIEELVDEDTYSFLFDGQLGYLDHALANDAMTGQVTDAAEWHVNADEVPLFDYNDTVRDAGEATFERESAATDLDEADARRSSDHDPVVVGLDLSSLVVDEAVIVTRPRGGGTLALSARVDGEWDSCPRVQLAVEGVEVVNTPTTRIGSTCIAITSRGIVTFGLDSGRLGAVLTLPTAFQLSSDNVATFAVRLDGVAHVVDQPGRRIGPIWTAS